MSLLPARIGMTTAVAAFVAVPTVVAQIPAAGIDTASNVKNILDNIITYDQVKSGLDGLIQQADSLNRFLRLTDEDFDRVANEYGIEAAAIRAVVEIEAGKKMEGFWAPGVPVASYDASIAASLRRKHAASPGDPDASVPKGLTGFALNKWTTLTSARRKDLNLANLSTFWGMFQIGGFNYRLCGCDSIEEYVEKVSRSEFDQLQLFMTFITKTGLIEDLKKKNWAGFARKYNGASYARRGYHTRMEAAYKRHTASLKTNN